jgi:hypothetical protein
MAAHTLAPASPAPHRHRIRMVAAAFALFAAPIAWATHLLVSYALTASACFPHGTPIHGPLWPALWPVLWGIDVVAIAIGLVAAAIAWRNWRGTRAEAQGSAHTLLEAGEGRTRFLALCGLLASGGFVLALAFASVGLLVVPACAG